jgi:cAMP-dependent protein kinase regulator
MPEPRLLELARHMRAQDLEAGTEVVRQGERGDQFFVIARGMFEVVVSGQPAVLLGRGNYFGERALLQGAPRAASVVAVEPGRVYWLDQTTFDTLLANDLDVRDRLKAGLAYRADLAEMQLFRDLAPAELDLLLTRITPVVVDAGGTIIRQGERGQRFYVVRSGGVDVLRNDDHLARLGPGDAFGEIALLLDVPRTASVIASAPTQLLALDAEAFRDVLASYLGRGAELRRLSHLRLRTHN